MTSKLRIDEIVDSTDTGSPAFPLGVTTTSLSYTGTLTGGTGVINIGSGQVYKDADGNVGLGTDNPAATGALFSVRKASGVLANFTNGVTADFIISTGVSTTTIGPTTATPLIFQTGNAESGRFDSSGIVKVGTTVTNPGYINSSTGINLHPNGISSFSRGGADFTLTVNNNNATTQYLIAFRYLGGAIGSITGNNTTTSYNTTSDYRLKTFIAPVTGSGARIDALEPVEFEWLVDGTPARGFFAHQFQEVYPDSVTGQKDEVDKDGNPVHQAMQASSSEVIADLVAEIQSLRARVAQLEGN